MGILNDDTLIVEGEEDAAKIAAQLWARTHSQHLVSQTNNSTAPTTFNPKPHLN